VKKVYPRLERSQEVENESQGGGGRMPGGGKGTKLSGTGNLVVKVLASRDNQEGGMGGG
jgi:hypothetical protein